MLIKIRIELIFGVGGMTKAEMLIDLGGVYVSVLTW